LFQWGQEADEQNQCVFFWCSAEPKKKSNAAVLVGAYLVLFGGVEAEAAYETLSRFQPFMPFRDPTCGISTYHLSVYDCIQAISKAQKLDWIDFNNFRLDEYEYFEQVITVYFESTHIMFFLRVKVTGPPVHDRQFW
jgi:cell division cycle 14